MSITPLEIRKKAFSNQLRGLSPKEVKSFLELVAQEIEELRKERGALSEKVDELTARLDTYERTESLLKETLVTAQKTHNELRSSAEQQSRAILSQAEQNAKQIMLQAEQDATQFKARLQELEARRASLVDQIRGLAHACLAMADTWEEKAAQQNDKTESGRER